jgi:predicted nucleic acid-binding Zn ribbon protein
MTYCKNCGAELEENAKFCSKCGTPVAMQPIERKEPTSRRRSTMSPWLIAGIAVLAVVVLAAIIAIPLLLGGLLPFTRVVGSGNLRTQEEAFSDFMIVDVGSGFKVNITQASSYSVSITADDNLFDYIQVTKTSNTLTIRLESGVSFQTSTLKAEITMPDLDQVQFSGGVTGTATGFVMSHDFKAELSGGSILTMDGEANNLTAECSGGSRLELSEFTVTNASINFSGGSQGTINLNGVLDADLSGGSHLFYIGHPTFGDINTSGGSNIAPSD